MNPRMASDIAPESAWFKSSYSQENGTACIEVAELMTGQIGIRDSKNPHGPALVVTIAAFTAFVANESSRSHQF
jgi:hypothetical protein